MRYLIWISIFAFSVVSCNAYEQENPLQPTLFEANFSVADSLDNSGDYAGFNILIFSRTSANAAADTVFFGVTDTSGNISGQIRLESEGSFPVQITRNGRNLASFRILLAGGDTVKVNGEFPGIQETLEVDSREARAMEMFRRVDTGFQRTNQFIISGQIPDSMITQELQKWTGLYWEVFEKQKGTFASKFALEQAITALSRFNRPAMFEKLNAAFEEDLAFGMAVTLGKQYVADTQGLEAAVSYIDSVRGLTRRKEIVQAIDKSKIKLYFDSARVEKARLLLEDYKDEFVNEEEELPFWYKNMRFEINEIPPGSEVPEFSFYSVDGDTITNSNMVGKAYILEFTLMANTLYQNQYDEAALIFQIYNSSGLEYYTIPFDNSANTIIGFFEERERFWGLADPPSFDPKGLTERFNIQYYPTRVLVDAEGNIVRKFVGEEFEDMIPAIIETLNINK
jgi:hypothetical protein